MRLTFGEMKMQVWQFLGEPDGLAPSSRGGSLTTETLLEQIINQAQLAITMWEDPSTKRKFRWKGFKGQSYLYGETLSGTLGAGSSAGAITVDTSIATAVREGDLVKISRTTGTAYEHTSLVMGVVGNTLYLVEDSDETPLAGDIVELYPVALRVSDVLVQEVLGVEDLTTQTALEKFSKETTNLSGIGAPGTPTAWDWDGVRVSFDVPLSGTYRYRLHVYKAPADLSADADYSELPDPVQFGVILKAVELGHIFMQEWQFAQEARATVDRFMRSTQDQWDLETAMRDGVAGSVRME
jgi:hypothetical protein